jgi:hypothetical protein
MSQDDSARGLTVLRRPTCENFLYVFKAARRAAGAPAPAAPTPGGWREKHKLPGRY